MDKNWRNIGLIALAAGVLYYPALRMYRLAHTKDGHGDEGDIKLAKGTFTVKKKSDGGNGPGNAGHS